MPAGGDVSSAMPLGDPSAGDHHLDSVEQPEGNVSASPFVPPQFPLDPSSFQGAGEMGGFVPPVEGVFNLSRLPSPSSSHAASPTPRAGGYREKVVQAMVQKL